MARGKRANGEGCIYYNEERKRYEGQFNYFDTTMQKHMRKKFTGKSKKIVAQKGKEFLDAQEKGLDFKASKRTLGEWLEIWLNDFVINQVKVKTFQRYAGAVKCHIKPYLGEVALDNLKAEKIQQAWNEQLKSGGMEQRGLATRTVNNARRILITSLDKACELGYLMKNVAKNTKQMKAEKARMCVLSHEEAVKLIACARQEGEVQAMVIILALASGMRIGEIFGLQWSNVVLEKGQITIEQTLVSTNQGSFLQPTPKTLSSHRTIILPEYAIEELKVYKAWQAQCKTWFGEKYINPNLVIVNQNGNYSDPSRFSYVVYKRLLKKAGIDQKVRFHDLRHTHATWLLEQGVNIKVVSERLGHSSIRITLDIYGHVLKGMQDQAVEAIDTILNSNFVID